MELQLLPPGTHVAYAHLTVADLARSLHFYRDTVGFQVVGEQDGATYLGGDPPAGLAAAPLRLTELPGAVKRPVRTTGLYHIAIRLPDRGGLSRTLRRMIETGWRFAGAADHGVSEALYTADPDGCGVELYVDRPRAEWPMAGGQVAMVSDPLDLDGLLAAGGEDAGPHVPAGTGMGHVHLQVSSLERARSFYHDLLGMQVTQASYPGALFLAAGDYHHHVGTNVWAGEDAPPPPSDAAGLRVLGLAIPDPAAREAAARRIQTAGLPVETTPSGFRTQDHDAIRLELV